mmetsp:Transcript_75577/g.179582  ORF Transcript_75577/g.179582 Transcript_75577/m.179582 type:complete len:194 (-) Transcript_75577:93-674(-)
MAGLTLTLTLIALLGFQNLGAWCARLDANRELLEEFENKTIPEWLHCKESPGQEEWMVDVKCRCHAPGPLKTRPGYHCIPNGCGPAVPETIVTIGNILYPDVQECCNVHDIDYCACTDNKVPADLKLRKCMRDICSRKDSVDYAWCTAKTEAAAYAVLKWGASAFKAAQLEACECPEGTPVDPWYDPVHGTPV